MIYLCELAFPFPEEMLGIFSSSKLAKQNDPAKFSSRLSYEHFDSGVRMGNGTFNLVCGESRRDKFDQGRFFR